MGYEKGHDLGTACPVPRQRPTLQQLQPQMEFEDARVSHVEALLGKMRDHLVGHAVAHGAKLQEHGAMLEDILQRQQLMLDLCQRQQLHTAAALPHAQTVPRTMTSCSSHKSESWTDRSKQCTHTEDDATMAKSKATALPSGGEPKLTASYADDVNCSPIAEDLSPDDTTFCPEQPALKGDQSDTHTKTVLGGRRTAHDVHIAVEVDGGTGCVSSFVKHRHFDHVVGAAILLNALVLFLQADNSVRHPKQPDPAFFDIMEIVFFIVFTTELAMRLYVFRWRFFTQEDYQWNWFDAVIVFTAFVELVIKFAVQKAINTNMAWLRLLRIIKISRLIRIIRVVRVFSELRIMVMSIVSTLRTLLWSLVCVLLIMSGIGCYFAWVVADHLASDCESDDSEMVQLLGSMPRIMTSLFQATTGGMDWRDLSDLLCRVSPLACAMFYAYISMMVFAILNILTGICVNNANKAADDDLDIRTEDMLQREDVARLRKILYADGKTTSRSTDMGKGVLTWAQLKVHLGDPKVRAYFKKIDLEPWHLRSFFQLLKVGDEEPEVDIDQFIRGCMRLRCNVKNIDLMAALHENKEYETRRCTELKNAIKEVSVVLSELQQCEQFHSVQGGVV